jgi:hypothetical protein
MTCEGKDKSTSTDITPGPMLLLKIPNNCYLSAKDFVLPATIDVGEESVTRTSFFSPINAFLVHTFTNVKEYMKKSNKEITGNAMSDANTIWPGFSELMKPIEIHKLAYNMSLDDVVSRVNEFGTNMSKAGELQKKKIKEWGKSIDNSLTIAADFKKLKAYDKSKGGLKALKDLISFIPNLDKIINALPLIVASVAFFISLLMFLATYSPGCVPSGVSKHLRTIHTEKETVIVEKSTQEHKSTKNRRKKKKVEFSEKHELLMCEF